MSQAKETVLKDCWIPCNNCKGQGKKRQRIRKKVKGIYQELVTKYNNNGREGVAPQPPKGNLVTCETCKGTGISESDHFLTADEVNLPHIAIIGAGIGGVALAVACLHRGIPYTLYERDVGFESRSQGYGLTLQQASKAVAGLGIKKLKKGVVSTRHVVHTTDGTIIGEWGMRKWIGENAKKFPKKTNIHIARQSLRLSILEQLAEDQPVQWGHQLLNLNEAKDGKITLTFNVNEQLISKQADLVVGADGIRSTVRNIIFKNDTQLQYLGCIVILGICPLVALKGAESDLLDAATVFQTANGHERMYMMPYDEKTVMWQFSFPMKKDEAVALSKKGPAALKMEALSRTQWHNPIPQIVEATSIKQISGYPVFDRELLKSTLFNAAENVTLIGDAAHPMSPFKGQGANQALLDALSLAKHIAKTCNKHTPWNAATLRKQVLIPFEKEMMKRTSIKVKDSRAAASLLHSKQVLVEGDFPRGRV